MSGNEDLDAAVLRELVYVCGLDTPGKPAGPIYRQQIRWRYPVALSEVSDATLQRAVARLRSRGLVRSERFGRDWKVAPTAAGVEAAS